MNRNVKIIGKTLLSGVLILSLVLGGSSFAEAKKISKQESVYVNAKADGTVEEITVADWLQNSGLKSGTVKDSSSLSGITNVKEKKPTGSPEKPWTGLWREKISTIRERRQRSYP